MSFSPFSCQVLACSLILGSISPQIVHAQNASAIPDQLHSVDAPDNGLWLDTLNLSQVQQGYGQAQAGHSVENNPLSLGGKAYVHGIGTHSIGYINIDLHGVATRFQSAVGVDDDRKGAGSVVFTVILDGKSVATTPVLHGGDQPQYIDVDLTGAKNLLLMAGDAGDGNRDDHADWAGASITLAQGTAQKPEIISTAVNAPPRLTILPPDPLPAIHGARIVGSTPGHPFLFPVAATGAGPLSFSALNLPDGLTLNHSTGIISGSLKVAGSTDVILQVKNSQGSSRRVLTIVGGKNKMALTPPMGWNSWNVWAGNVDEQKVKDAAKEMISAGLVAHGYQYVNIDDTWQGPRDANGNIMPNQKFSDMKALCDDLHAKGLKIGTYSSPGPTTCAGCTGSYQHEDQDAQTYAEWGFDYLKYDMCSYGGILKDHSVAEVKKPYRVMAAALSKVNRDFVYSLCEYGDASVWQWGSDIDIQGNCWRTHNDIDDNWTEEGSRGLYDIIEAEVGHEKFAGPGHWNDPDMLMVGLVGFGNPHPTRLTPNEQILHISMWSLLSAPLLIGCDMTKLDAFTTAVLTNDEVIDINQDPLGRPAGRISKDGSGHEVWARELFDGTRAVGLLNPLPVNQTITVHWSDLGLTGKQAVRDLWLHQDVGSFDDSYSVEVPGHGMVLVKVGTAVK